MRQGRLTLALVRALALAVVLLGAAFGSSAAEPARLLAGFGRAHAAIETTKACHLLDIYLAVGTEQRAQGLMYVRKLDEHEGMLFRTREPAVVSMWMKNTYIPLDMVFIGEDGRVASIAANTTPLSEATVSSGEPVVAVLELVGGFAARHGVAKGDRLILLD